MSKIIYLLVYNEKQPKTKFIQPHNLLWKTKPEPTLLTPQFPPTGVRLAPDISPGPPMISSVGES